MWIGQNTNAIFHHFSIMHLVVPSRNEYIQRSSRIQKSTVINVTVRRTIFQPHMATNRKCDTKRNSHVCVYVCVCFGDKSVRLATQRLSSRVVNPGQNLLIQSNGISWIVSKPLRLESIARFINPNRILT